MKSISCLLKLSVWSCIHLAAMNAPALAGDQSQGRLFFLPPGVDPNTTTPGQPFVIEADGDTTIIAQAYLTHPGWEVTLTSLGIECDVASSLPDRPPLHYIAASASFDERNPYSLIIETPGLLAMDHGQCEIIDCTDDPNVCRSAHHCQNAGVCRIFTPIISVIVLGDPVVPNNPRYLGQFSFTIPFDAEGTYTLRPSCCPGDANCDTMQDAGCMNFKTYIATTVGQRSPELIDPLVIRIRAGSCTTGHACSDGLTRIECEEDLGGTFHPNTTCPDAVPTSSTTASILFAAILLTAALTINARRQRTW